MGSHIFTAALQPATSYADATFDPPMFGGYAPGQMIFCEACDECWPAAQMVVQCYYDGRRFWCAQGHGCKDVARLEAHRERTRKRRSMAQKERHWREREAKASTLPGEGEG